MASSNDPLFGRMKGGIGNIVVYQMFGKTVLRTKPNVKRKPASGRLKECQTDFKHVMHLMQLARTYIATGFHEVADGRSAFHTALSINLKRYKSSEDKALKDWLQLSSGKRAGAIGISLLQKGVNQIEISWKEAEPGKPASENDWVFFFAIERSSQKVCAELYVARRKHGRTFVQMPNVKAGELYDCFLTFKSDVATSRKQAELISDSIYACEINFQ